MLLQTVKLIKKAKHTLATYLSQVIVLGSGFVLMWLINKFMGVIEYGKFAIIVATAGVALKLTAARTGEAVIKFYIGENEERNSNNSLATIYLGLIIDGVSAFISCGLIILLAGLVSSEMSPQEPIVIELSLFSIFVLLSFIKSTPMGYFQAKSQFSFINFVNAVEAVIKIAALATFIFFLKGKGVVFAVYSTILASFVVTIVVLIKFYYELKYDFINLTVTFDKEFFFKYLSFSLKTFSSASLKAVNQTADVLILGFFTNPATVGLYEALKKVGSAISFVSLPFPFIAFPKFSKYFAQKKFNLIWEVVLKKTLIILIMAVCLSICLVIFIEDLFAYLNISHNELSLLFIITAVTFTANACIWWGRIYSSVVDPFISLKINSYITLYLLAVATLATKYWGLYGILYAMLVMNFLVLASYCLSAWSFSNRVSKDYL